jgi:hypothetical protein
MHNTAHTIWVLADISTRNQTKRKDVFLNLHVFYGSVGGLSAYLLRPRRREREREREKRRERETSAQGAQSATQRKRPHKDTRGTHRRGHCSMWLPFISNLAPKQHIGNEIQHLNAEYNIEQKINTFFSGCKITDHKSVVFTSKQLIFSVSKLGFLVS